MVYDYQIGIIRAKETNLLKKSDWDRILDFISLRDTWNELVRIDMGYKEISDVSDIINNISKFYSKILLNHYRETTGYFIEEELKKSFLYEFDFFNLKLIYKQKYFHDENFKNDFIDSGYYSPQIFLDYMMDDKPAKEFLGKDILIRDILKILMTEELSLSPVEFDILLDNYLFEYRLNVAKKLDSKFLLDFWRIQIDFYNLKLMLDNNTSFIKNGFVPDVITKEGLEKYGYKDIAKKAFALENWEILEENYLLEFCEKAVWFSLSSEPIIAYFYRRSCEIKNLNRILYGRAFQLSNTEIKNQLSKSYIF